MTSTNTSTNNDHVAPLKVQELVTPVRQSLEPKEVPSNGDFDESAFSLQAMLRFDRARQEAGIGKRTNFIDRNGTWHSK